MGPLDGTLVGQLTCPLAGPLAAPQKAFAGAFRSMCKGQGWLDSWTLYTTEGYSNLTCCCSINPLTYILAEIDVPNYD